MGQYVYSGYLRRRATELFARAGVVFNVLVVGNRPSELRLFAAFAKVSAVPDIAAGDGEHDHADIVFCGFSDLAGLCKLFSASGFRAVRALSIRSSIKQMDADVLSAIHELCTRFHFKVHSLQSAASDFGNAHDLTLILLRADQAGAVESLKLAVILEAHSLHAKAIDFVRAYNKAFENADDHIDELSIDRTYEVAPFSAGEFTAMLNLQAPPMQTTATAEPQEEQSTRHLSIHCDAFHRPEGEQRLIQLAQSLVWPTRVEMLLRVPGNRALTSVAELTETIRQRGVGIKIFVDSSVDDGPNPAAPEFVGTMAPEARLAAYFTGEAIPLEPGWDHDLLQIMDTTEAKVFTLKLSRHKTRYWSAPVDAVVNYEPLPVVSRVWLETCGAWSTRGLSAPAYQSLVAFYFGRSDWRNKHRLLRVWPVMRLRLDRELDDDGRIIPRRRRSLFRQRHIPAHAEENAIRIALMLQMREWTLKESRPHFMEYQLAKRALLVRDALHGAIIKRWSVRPDRSRLPL